ncbi:HNH endonuclease family protein [Streptomyces sp. ISL-100]|uniref:HNH endonuclease family protein n=1 Tax=Streptomyces sp. ISL-100 TaxID=2819173 RepID=UPI001BEC6B60|nr:HNH endonuclease family protein [Streptomyces sp. ISL-100]MBT2400220.1 HNH endonuclease [Streptomyces sp. ISL-100]
MRKLSFLVSTLLIATTVVVGAAPGADAAPGDTVSTTVEKAIENLPVAAEDSAGYSIGKFKHWTDPDQDGCSTRAEVLIAEATTPPAVDRWCTITGGAWHSYYDKKDHSGAGSLDVDHLVPPAEAWRSGAWAWTDEERERYANDMADPRVLAAVTASEKRLKGDRDPARWEPSDDSADCRYIAEWAAVKGRWKLSVDSAELAALQNMVVECPTEEITYELAL